MTLVNDEPHQAVQRRMRPECLITESAPSREIDLTHPLESWTQPKGVTQKEAKDKMSSAPQTITVTVSQALQPLEAW